MTKQKNIYMRGCIYWIRYTGVDGKQVRESTKSDKLRDAQSFLKLREGEVAKGEQPDIVKIKNHSFSDLAEKYLEFCANQRDIRNKESLVGMLKSEFGNLPLKSFTLDLVERYQSRILQARLTETTANRKIAVLKHMFTKAADWCMVTEAICKTIHKVKLFKVDNARIRFLGDTEIKELLDACDHVRVLKSGKEEKKKQNHLKPIIIFALNSGCRREEILSLKWEQVDLRHGFINLVRTKNGERRQVPINDTLREMLQGLVRRLDVPWVFFDSETGKRFTDVKRSFSTACKKAGIVDFHFHDLRHTFASHLVMGGVDLTTVSRLMGHKSLSMTLRYSHLAPSHLVSAVNVLNSTMNPTSTKLAQQPTKKGLAI